MPVYKIIQGREIVASTDAFDVAVTAATNIEAATMLDTRILTVHINTGQVLPEPDIDESRQRYAIGIVYAFYSGFIKRKDALSRLWVLDIVGRFTTSRFEGRCMLSNNSITIDPLDKSLKNEPA